MASLLRMINVWPLCFLLVLKASQLQAATREECKTFKYKHYAIQFPFRVKEHQPAHCGYHGFQLSHSKNNQILLELPHDVKMVVKSINYKAQTIDLLFDTRSCFVLQLPNLNLSASPFQRQSSDSETHFVFFNCSRKANGGAYKDYDAVPCLSGPSFQVIALYNSSNTFNNFLNCRRTLLDLSGKLLDYDMVYSKTSDHVITLSWSKPNCRQCAVVGRKCKLNTNNSTQGETECYGTTKKQRDMWKALLAVGLSLAFCLVGMVLCTLFQAYRSYRAEKKSRLKIEKFLQDYKALKPSRYSYADIKRITDQFKDQLGEGGFGTVFKGRLSNDVLVAVKVLNNFVATGEEFINEVGSMCRIHHINVTRLIGFCADGNKRALVYEFMPNESLDKFIFRAIDEEDRFLSWEKLECIANGTAKGIEYLHNGCDQQILHFDIKPHNILLDHNFNPKISDFGLAKLCSKEQSAVSMTAARGTMGYIAPEVLSRNFGKASHKSDVYSYGMLLLEMVGGRKNIDVRQENTSQVYFPEWVYNFLDRGQELEIRIENEVHSKIARKLTIVGLWCIQWYPADRPSMKDVIYMLEEEVENLTVPPNPFDHGGGSKTGPSQPNNKELHVINELE